MIVVIPTGYGPTWTVRPGGTAGRLGATITDSLGRLRQLAFELHPPPLERVGLATALHQYAPWSCGYPPNGNDGQPGP